MLTRRKLVLGAALAVLVPAAPALAAPDPLLADILYGVSDALIRDYIYRNYEYGRWDGRYWWYRGNRYTPATYRRFWIDDYYRHYPPPPPAHRPPPGHRPPPPPHFDGPGGRPPPPLRPPHFAGGRPPGGPGPRPPQPPHGPGPHPPHFGGPGHRPPHAGGPGPSPARRRSASASLRRSGRQRPGRSRRSPLTPLRLNRSRTSHRDAGPSPIHGLPTVSIQVPVFGLTNVRWRTIILAMEG